MASAAKPVVRCRASTSSHIWERTRTAAPPYRYRSRAKRLERRSKSGRCLVRRQPRRGEVRRRHQAVDVALELEQQYEVEPAVVAEADAPRTRSPWRQLPCSVLWYSVIC